MRKYLVVAAALLLGLALANPSKAQYNNNAVGLRLGTFSGITFKHFFDSRNAIDGIFTFGGNTVGIVGLYEIHQPIREVPNLDWYYGGGAHLVFVNGDRHYWNETQSVALGVDGVVGLNYSFDQIPLNLSLDLSPSINIADNPGVGLHAGFSMRYIF